MPRGSDRRAPMWRTIGGGSAVAVAALAALVWVATPGPGAPVAGAIGSGSAAVTLLSMIVDRDLGRMPSRGTGDGEFCGAVGTLGTPEHCWPFGASGTVADLGDATTLWDLTALGSPRTGIVTGIPVADATGWVDFSASVAAALPGPTVGYAYAAGDGVSTASTQSITMILRLPADMASGTFADFGRTSHRGTMFYHVLGNIQVYADGADSETYAYINTLAPGPAWQCLTVVVNEANSTAFLNGVEVGFASSLAGHGSLASSSMSVGIGTKPSATSGTSVDIESVRLDFGVATLADHQALCGTYAQPLRADHAAYADTSWTQTGGGVRCFQTGANRATCFPGGKAAYAYSPALAAAGYSGYGWAVEPGRVNRLLYNSGSDLNCVNWTCTGRGAELLTDGDMEAAGVGDWPTTNGTLTKEVAAPHGGSQSIRIAYLATNNPYFAQNVLESGKAYAATGWAHGDTSKWPTMLIGGSVAWTGTASDTWQELSGLGVAGNTLAAFRCATSVSGYSEFDDLSVKEVFPTVTTAVAPDGSLTAASIVFDGAETISYTATGYTASATIYPRFWAKCSAGTLDASNLGGAGHWEVDCTAIGGVWELLHAGHDAVTVITPWTADGAGAATFGLSGADVSIWLPTVTQTPGLSVIPVGSAAVDTASIVWLLDNDPPVYYNNVKGRQDIVSDYISEAGAGSYPVYSNDGKRRVYLAQDYLYDASGTVLRCSYGYGVTNRSFWFDSVAGSGGLDLSGVAQSCAISASAPWTAPSSPTAFRFANGAFWQNAIYRSIEFKDRP